MNSLRTVKVTHTVIWVFFVACILAIPLFTALSRFRLAVLCAAIVGVEVAVLLLNGFTCPLTNVAARYTSDRRANFDIYLPEWLARHNKAVFGTLYIAAVFLLVVRWVASL
jgi:tetrahydromethanopterin S-methyltransferase subunit E